MSKRLNPKPPRLQCPYCEARIRRLGKHLNQKHVGVA